MSMHRIFHSWNGLWHVISPRALKPGFTGREVVWNFVDGLGVRNDRSNEFKDWQPEPNAITNHSPDTYKWQGGGQYFSMLSGKANRPIRPWGWDAADRQRISKRKWWGWEKKWQYDRWIQGVKANPPDIMKSVDQERMARYEAILKKLHARGVKVLAVFPPMCTDPESQWDSEDRTPRYIYDGLVGYMQGLQEKHPNFVYRDVHQFGDNGYDVKLFSDADHLNIQGAVKFSQELEELRQAHTEQ